ncbi:ankyrin repeat domain-containing protein [Streptomyces sp. RLA2-12]|uniref:ankyrin repeat domain-containing protein n=1 Tax=Streptomyces sp. RLA2-12 TaxID=2721242 RepID=UPI001B7D07DF
MALRPSLPSPSVLATSTPSDASSPIRRSFPGRAPRWSVQDPHRAPRGGRLARLLSQRSADRPAARGCRRRPEHTQPGRRDPLHWAASSDDVDVAAALIDAGADIEAPDGSIGTPLDNAVGYACWHVAALLAARGARVNKLWHAAALGMLERLQQLLDAANPTSEEVSQAFWHACCAGQRRAAEHLLAVGADLNWVPDLRRGHRARCRQGLWHPQGQRDRLA